MSSLTLAAGGYFEIDKDNKILDVKFELNIIPRLIKIKFCNIVVKDLTDVKVYFNDVLLEDIRKPHIDRLMYTYGEGLILPNNEAIYIIDENLVFPFVIHRLRVDASALEFGEYSRIMVIVN